MKAIILAAGHGKRMKSKTHKVLHTIAGKPMLHHVIDTCLEVGINDITVVVGHQGDTVREATPQSVHFVTQSEQLGTGHAVMCAKESIAPDDTVLVLYGDTPLLTSTLLSALSDFQQKNQAHAVVVSTTVSDPQGYGRVIIERDNIFSAIVEQRDLSPEQEAIARINTGTYIFTGRELLYGLEHIGNDNHQNEYYLTDVPAVLQKAGHHCLVYHDTDYQQFLGINSQAQLAEAAVVMKERILHRHLENGVVMIDPSTVYIDWNVSIEPGATLLPGVMLEGNCAIAEGAIIGPYSRLINTTIGVDTMVQNSVLESTKIGDYSQVGPFAYLRPGTVVGNHCRVGDFVELKNATLGDNSKASHLAYVGDTTVGAGVNIGCGVVTVNYDGVNKHRTIIEDNAFVGSNVNLIAPVAVRAGAFVAAGSTITDEVPSEAFAIARQRQTNKEGRAPKRKT